MCGIAGIVRLDDAPVDEAALERLTAALTHRGPDGSGRWVSGGVGLGHTRLAIIDPAHGSQPMVTDDGRVAITYNGELYNFRELRRELEGLGHRFTTACDTEVVLRAWVEWQERCVERFRGMFAFAIADRGRGRLFLARDHFGIKPLVYFADGGRLCFASELQALRTVPGFPDTLDLGALDRYLALSYIPAPLTVFRGVQKLPPAHYVVAHLDGRVEAPVRYWQLALRPEHRRAPDEWLDELEAVLRESVRAHLVADVPFGAFLSGGIDSSLVVSLMAQEMREPVRTFSIGFRESEYDELPYARVVRDRWNTTHHEEIVTADALGVLETLVRHYGEPFGDWSAVPIYHLARLARRNVPMVLSGDGGDEAFVGYRRYHRRFSLRTRLSAWLAATAPWEAYAMMVLRAPARRALWRPELRRGLGDGDDPLREPAPARRLPQMRRAQLLDYRTYLPGAILNKVDIAAMAHGLEVRTPLVDRRVVEFAATIPDELLIARDGGPVPEGKQPPRALLRRSFPDDFVRRPKQGFVPPVAAWLAAGGALRAAVEGALLDRRAHIGTLFQPSAIAAVVADADRTGRAEPLWLLYFLERWLDARYGYSRQSAGVDAGSTLNRR